MAKPLPAIEGKKFGMLTVIEKAEKRKNGWHYLVSCECGNQKIIRGTSIKSGKTKSCGCLVKTNVSIAATKRHQENREKGVYKTTSSEKRKRLHKVWDSMKGRCKNPSYNGYKYYGGKGIGYCDEWESFENFYNDMHQGYEKGLTLDRIDGSKGYSKENCRWVTYTEQNRNLSSNRLIDYRGIKYTLSELAELSGIHYQTLRGRLNRGWNIEDAVNTNRDMRIKVS